MSGNPQIDIVHVLGWMGNLSRTLVIRREIGRFKNRETKPSWGLDRKSTRLNSSHSQISYAVFCLKKKKNELSAWCYAGAFASYDGLVNSGFGLDTELSNVDLDTPLAIVEMQYKSQPVSHGVPTEL